MSFSIHQQQLKSCRLRSIDGHAIGNGKRGLITEKLQQAFKAKIPHILRISVDNYNGIY